MRPKVSTILLKGEAYSHSDVDLWCSLYASRFRTLLEKINKIFPQKCAMKKLRKLNEWKGILGIF